VGYEEMEMIASLLLPEYNYCSFVKFGIVSFLIVNVALIYVFSTAFM
jgi:hypothetical protein